MTTKTICRIIRDLHAVRGDEKTWRCIEQLHKWLQRIHPPRPHQTFSAFAGRYVDEGE